jgi:hypothetical protein
MYILLCILPPPGTLIHDTTTVLTLGFVAFDVLEQQVWLRPHRTISVYFGPVNVALIGAGEEWMRSRKPYSVKPAFTLRDFFIAIFYLRR